MPPTAEVADGAAGGRQARDISLEDEWGERASRMRIVAIGTAGGVDAGFLENPFASCISAVTGAG